MISMETPATGMSDLNNAVVNPDEQQLSVTTIAVHIDLARDKSAESESDQATSTRAEGSVNGQLLYGTEGITENITDTPTASSSASVQDLVRPASFAGFVTAPINDLERRRFSDPVSLAYLNRILRHLSFDAAVANYSFMREHGRVFGAVDRFYEPTDEEIEMAYIPRYPPRPRGMIIDTNLRPNVDFVADSVWTIQEYTGVHFDMHIFKSVNDYAIEKQLPAIPSSYVAMVCFLLYRVLTTYNILFALAILGNLSVFLATLFSKSSLLLPAPGLYLNAVAVNIAIVITIRQDWLINMAYWLVRFIPLSAPFWFRRFAAGIYENGGIHSGCAISSGAWYILLVHGVANQYDWNVRTEVALLVFTYSILLVLACIIFTSHPYFRSHHHNTFEYVHRFGGWLLLSLFWGQLTAMVAADTPQADYNDYWFIFRQPAFYFLSMSTIFTALPWLNLRRIEAHPVALSQNAVQLFFEEPIHLFKGVSLSRTPFGQGHSFAAIPSRDGGLTGFSVLIAKAGDWTHSTIRAPKTYYWLRGIPRTGVLCIAPLFRSVLVFATGSGIGPVLGVVQDLPEDCVVHIVWITTSPWLRYGRPICGAVLAVDPGAVIADNALIRSINGAHRIDAFTCVYNAFVTKQPEAVLIISNKETTASLKVDLRSRGIPAFGPIWDS